MQYGTRQNGAKSAFCKGQRAQIGLLAGHRGSAARAHPRFRPVEHGPA